MPALQPATSSSWAICPRKQQGTRAAIEAGGAELRYPQPQPPSSNRISKVVTGTTTTRTFTHDGAGNIVSDTRSGSVQTYGINAQGRLAIVRQDGNLKDTYQYDSLEQLASRVVTNSGPFDGRVHTGQDRSGNIIAEADGTPCVVSREYIWLSGSGYAGTDLPIGGVDVAGTATPELLYVHADHLSRPIRLTDAAKITAWAVECLHACGACLRHDGAVCIPCPDCHRARPVSLSKVVHGPNVRTDVRLTQP